MKIEKIQCPNCQGDKTNHETNNKNIYFCYECKHKFNIKKIKPIKILKKQFILNNDISEKDKKMVFDLLNKNKFIYLNNNNKNFYINKFLNTYNIIVELKDNTYKGIFDYINNTTYTDCHCNLPDCDNETKFYGFQNSIRKNGYKDYCSDECCRKHFSIKQIGEGNTFNRITDENLEKMKNKLSIHIKNKIKNGEFKPNILNSWKCTSYDVKINNEIRNFRSCWEAFFNLVNVNLEYEKILIPYEFKNSQHTYIVDFVDYENRILYEIKPNSQLIRDVVKTKTEYAKEWCKNNNYEFVIIGDDWFYENYPKYDYLLNEQEEKNRMQKNLKKFSYENKKHTKN